MLTRQRGAFFLPVSAPIPPLPTRAARSTRIAHSVAIAATIVAVVAVLVIALAATGTDVATALIAFWDGSFGSLHAFTSATLVRAVPLTLAGLAVALAFRAGVWNIGAEGQLLAGAAAGTATALATAGTLGIASLPLALIAASAAGMLWAGIAALLRQRYGVLEVISTIMLNFLALHVVGFLVRGPLQEAERIYPQTETLAAIARLPRLMPGSRLHLGIGIALVAAVLVWYALRFTSAGFRVRASGENPHAARVGGRINVAATTTGAFLVSGAIAGLAGAVEVTGVTYALYENLSPGYGYTAIAVALLARLHPLGVLASGIGFGALEAGALAMQREAGVPVVVVHIVQGTVVLLVLAGTVLARTDVIRHYTGSTAPPSNGPQTAGSTGLSP